MLELRVTSRRIKLFACLDAGKRSLKLIIFFILATGAFFGIRFGWQKMFVENSEFVIKDFQLRDFEGNETRFLNHERLQAQTGIDPKATIFSVDTEKLEKALLALPEITKVKVSRRLPGNLNIEVEERQPIAWLACRSLGITERDRATGLLVDVEGIPFKCASDALWEYAETLPVVMVPAAGEGAIVEGEPIRHEGLRHAFDLVMMASEKLEGIERPAWIVVKDEITLEMKTLSGILATLSYYEQERQLDNLTRVTAHAISSGRDLEWVNLIPRKYVPVRYRGDS